MNSYVFADHLIQFALNGLVGFFLFSLLTLLAIKLFKIKSFRVRALLRIIPFLRLALEPLFLLVPSSWAVLNVSFFSCSHPLQYFLFKHFSFANHDLLGQFGLTTVIGSLLIHIPLPVLYLSFAILIWITLYRIMRFLFQCYQSAQHVKILKRRGVVNHRAILGKELIKVLSTNNIEIVLTDEAKVPFTGWGRQIFMPKHLSEILPQQEFEAVVAHELEHYRWKDTLLRSIFHGIAILFWWVPSAKWQRKLEQEQELACDSSIFRYNIDGINLAAALQKTAQQERKAMNFSYAAFSLSSAKPLLERVHAILHPMDKQNKFFAVVALIALLGAIPLLISAIC